MSFTDPVRVSDEGQSAYTKGIAVGPSGTATVAFEQIGPDGAAPVVAQIAPDGSVGPLTRLEAGVGRGPEVQVDADGVATVVWIAPAGGKGVIRYVRVAPDGTVGETREVPATDPGWFLATAIDDDGRVHIVWTESRGAHATTVVEGELTASGAFDSVRTVSDRKEEARWPGIAVDPSGRTWLAWDACPTNPDKWRCGIRTATVSAAGRASKDRLIFDPKNRNAYGVTDVSAGRLAIEKVHRRRHVRALFSRMSVQFVDLSDGREPAAKTLSTWIGTYQTAGINPQIVTSSEGRSVLAWNNFHRIDAVRIGPEGHISAPFILSDPDDRATGLELVMDGIDRTTVLWRGRHSVDLAKLDDRGRVVGTERVVGDNSDAAEPIVGVNDSGVTTVLWDEFGTVFATVGQ
ncbi:MAG: hypothetical protein U0R51_03665 [Solirubrobacterales bacterium]